MILIKVEPQTRENIEITHWEWFKNRMKRQCSWEKSCIKSYFDFIKENVSLDLNQLNDAEYENRLQQLVCGFQGYSDEDEKLVC